MLRGPASDGAARAGHVLANDYTEVIFSALQWGGLPDIITYICAHGAAHRHAAAQRGGHLRQAAAARVHKARRGPPAQLRQAATAGRARRCRHRSTSERPKQGRKRNRR